MLSRIVEFDQVLFRRINQHWIHHQIDPLASWVRESTNWIPLYAALLAWAIWKFRWTGLVWFLTGLLAVGLSDLIGNYGFKHVFERLRPCNDPSLHDGLRLLVDTCGSGYSFISNHAANHMCLAFYVWISLRERIGNWGGVGIVWALLISYAQVYVGLHFPLDVIAGSLLGGAIGSGVALSFRHRYKSSIFPANQLVK